MTLSEALKEAKRLESALAKSKARRADAITRIEAAWNERVEAAEKELAELRAKAQALFEETDEESAS